MKAYTVILLRPDYLCDDGNFGQDVYVALIPAAADAIDALLQAQQEVFTADLSEGCDPESPDDYALVVTFEGIQQPVQYGWQL